MAEEHELEFMKAENEILKGRIQSLENLVKDLSVRVKKLEDRPKSTGNFEFVSRPGPGVSEKKEDNRVVTGLVISDSNRKHISPAGLSFGERKTIIYGCGVLENTKEVIDDKNKTRKINPDNIILSVGTNNWDNDTSEQLIDKMKVSLEYIKCKWPEAEIKVSEILPRNDKSFDEVKEINNQIEVAMKEMNIKVIKHQRITKDDLSDNKHLKVGSAYKLALDWKFNGNPKTSWTRKRKSELSVYQENLLLKRKIAELF